jgi:hypothetical protein
MSGLQSELGRFGSVNRLPANIFIKYRKEVQNDSETNLSRWYLLSGFIRPPQDQR